MRMIRDVLKNSSEKIYFDGHNNRTKYQSMGNDLVYYLTRRGKWQVQYVSSKKEKLRKKKEA